MRTVLMTISEEDARRIFAGVKHFEYTKLRAIDAQRIIFYVKRPVKKVVGEAISPAVYNGTPGTVWRATDSGAGMTRREYLEHVGKAENVSAYRLTQVRRYPSPRPITDYGVRCGSGNAIYLGDLWKKEDSEQLRDDMDAVAAKCRNTFKLLADA